MRSPLAFTRRQVVLAAGAALLGCTPSEPRPESRPEARPSPPRARDVVRLVQAEPTKDGAGVKLKRALGSRALPMLDPFLLLDEIASDDPDDYIRGFPTHPHRGFETVTYMIDGAMEHQDSLGNRGHLGPGSAQWMTAGHGIVHSEMPKQENGLLWGFQLWVNLPKAKKLTRPRYQDIAQERVAELWVGDAHARLVAGSSGDRRGPVEGIVTDPLMMDVELPPRGKAEQLVPNDHNAFAYCVQGSVRLGASGARLAKGELAVLGPGDLLVASSDDGGRFLLFAARPLGEPVARYGPFVMNTDAEIEQAVRDYQSGRLVEG